MTAAPQPERIPMKITSEQMARVYNAPTLQEAHSVMDEIRDLAPSHPRTSAPTPNERYVLKVISDAREEILERLSSPFSTETIKEMQEIARKHDAAIAKQERERTADDIMRYLAEHGVEKRPEGYFVVSGTFSLGGFIKHLETLRSGGEP